MAPKVTVALQTDKPIAAYGYLAAQAEAYGFDGVSVYNDLLYQPAWLPLLEIARQTKTIRIGPAAVNPFTCHPLNIAGNLALIDAASGGRAYCGFARGAWLDYLGLHPRQPAAAVEEAMRCVRHLLRRDKEPFLGQHFLLQGGDSLRWEGIRRNIPFLLGSWGEKTIQTCLPLVTEIKLGGTANPDLARHMKHFVDAQQTGTGIVCGAVTVVDIDGTAARRLARREVALYLPVIAGLDHTLVIEPQRLAGIRAAMDNQDIDRAVTFISDDLLRKFAFSGTPDEVTVQALDLFEAGADRVEFGTPHGLSPDRGLALLGEIVLPQIRAALAR